MCNMLLPYRRDADRSARALCEFGLWAVMFIPIPLPRKVPLTSYCALVKHIIQTGVGMGVGMNGPARCSLPLILPLPEVDRSAPHAPGGCEVPPWATLYTCYCSGGTTCLTIYLSNACVLQQLWTMQQTQLAALDKQRRRKQMRPY